MQYSLSSKYDSNKLLRISIDIFTWIFRLLAGGTFIFSGFVKAVDPWGTYYKFEEYIGAIGISILPSLLLCGVFALCATEFIIGISIVTGCYRKSSPWVALAFMCLMLPLTLWIAISDPVKDCGCFGDFFIISNWATFYKNIILTLLIIWLIKFNDDEITIISPAFQWLQIVFSILFIGIIMLYGYFIQPMLDFRAYPLGEEIVNNNSEDEEDENFIFIYEKDGIKKEFTINDELPSEEDGWKFLERKNIASPNLKQEKEKTLRIWDIKGDNDVTDEIFDNDGNMILLLIPDLSKVSPSTTWKINSIYDDAVANGVKMIAIVSGSTEQIKDWEDLSMPEYEIYTSDDTSIKEVARGNPAIVYLSNGIIKWKSTLSAINNEEVSENNKLLYNPTSIDSKQLIINLTFIYIVCLAVLVAMSMLPRIRNVFTRGDKVRHGE